MGIRVARRTRDRYGLGNDLLPARLDADDAPVRSRRLAHALVSGGASRPERTVRAGDLAAIEVLHEVGHRVVERDTKRGRGLVRAADQRAEASVGADRAGAALVAFESAFPGPPVFDGTEPTAWLAGATRGRPNRRLTLEELLFLWVANQNPAVMRYAELFDDRELAASSDYPQLVAGLREASASRATGRSGGVDLIERLLEPARMEPGSLVAQLRWIAANWGDLLDDELLGRLNLVMGALAEEEASAARAFEDAQGGPGTVVDAAALHGFADGEPERFSPDRDWMPDVVLMAKSTYVWLDQLSRAHDRPIRTLADIPDAELDRLRQMGVSGLWLIGIWERSPASQRIKQLRGNSEAVASAYSLMDYRIAEDLGGDTAYGDLRDRAWARGLRLASDMVPNHMGIDARWVRDHPDWFIGRDEPPFPAYTFEGPNLSSDERLGIYLEDHYYDGSDAAVVFKRVDRWSGQVRYLYHGNDGTSFPWNDTAQLDYLNGDVREAVIQTIVAVARKFPIIRFDAAMVLARKHIQRLWYPLPGQGGGIPSRSESALPQAAFESRMPAEFWREVVDRVAAEAPDTLLLAEAFWLLEGYFVRTLGMHRVYNSAFMHMLRDEKNAEYRSVIRETVAFDPEILKRYVNFMNNPDERTAIDQFGDGDKYFGVATLLATLPGLPMLGHGQVEGFGEKYGMEYRRALLEERPSEDLIARHDREIFPLLRERWRFADAREFHLLDAVGPDGAVDEDVFAYANGNGPSRSLVVYRNRYREGPVRIAGVPAALAIPDEADRWLVLHDRRSGLDFLRNAHDLHQGGLELDLHAYQCHVFVDPVEVIDGPSRDWARLAWRLGGSGVPDAFAALEDELLGPIRAAVAAVHLPEHVRDIAGAALAPDERTGRSLADRAASGLEDGIAAVARAAGETGAQGVTGSAADEAQSALRARLERLVSTVRVGRSDAASAGERSLAGWLGTDRERWLATLGWALVEALGGIATFGPWRVGAAIEAAGGELGLDDERSSRAAVLAQALAALPSGVLSAGDQAAPSPGDWFARPEVRAATGWNEWQGDAYVDQRAWEEWLLALAARELLEEASAVVPGSDPFDLAEALRVSVAGDGYRVRASDQEA